MLALAGLAGTQALAQETRSGIPLDQPWKQTVYEFASASFQHTAWGLEHSERDYHLAQHLARLGGVEAVEEGVEAGGERVDLGLLPGDDRAERRRLS